MAIWRRRRRCTAAASTRSAASTDAAAAAAAAAPAAYPGKIKRDNRDGTFDVLFDDGDRDQMVPERSIKKLSSSPRKSAMDSENEGLGVGDKVEARCKGSTRYYPGKIKRDNRDGTFDALVDDGDRDPMVPEQSIKKPGGESGVAGNDDEVTRGGEVEARCKGSVKYLLSWYDQA